jgi:hypothetical protein
MQLFASMDRQLIFLHEWGCSLQSRYIQPESCWSQSMVEAFVSKIMYAFSAKYSLVHSSWSHSGAKHWSPGVHGACDTTK